ncbi:MAG TPA: hypothetical protein VEX13_09850 [Chloroflexia bacterium]|nr:hypothetical protein [Chloroflexia bacterium]
MQATLRPVRNRLQIALPALAATLAFALLGVVAMVAATSANSNSGPLSSAQSAGTNSVQAQPANPWPAFVMVFREEAYSWETGKVASSDVYKYVYNGREHWQLELLESTRDPRAVGSRTEYNSATFTEAGVVDGHPLPVRTTKADRPYMASWWLVPVAPSRLGVSNGYQQAADAPEGKIRLYKDELLPCSSLLEVWQVRLCGTGKQSYTQRTEKVMDPEHGIPLEITEWTEGKVTATIKIEELTYK